MTAVPFRVALIAAVAAAGFSQQEMRPRREGGYWVDTVTGSFGLPKASRLRIDAYGPVTVRGDDSTDSVSYSLRKRVRAREMHQARELLNRFAVKVRQQGGWVLLSVSQPGGNHIAELTVTAPSRIATALLETHGGDVEAYDLDGEIHAETAGGRILMDRILAAVSARTGGGEIRLGKIGGAVRCLSGGGAIRLDTAGGEAFLESAGGEILVREAKGPVRASTAGGSIHVERAWDTVTASTAGGLIDVQHATGLVVAETSGGSIQIGAAGGVQCESAAGAIRLKGISGQVRATTATGNILAAIPDQAQLEDSFLNTGGGDVTVFLPSNVAVTVHARNESGGAGRIISDFPEIRLRGGDGRISVAEGALNGGGPLLRIYAVRGTIYLRRQR